MDDRIRDAWVEIERIDYLLNEIARSVEQGVIPYATYETLAPRYLSRREALVCVVTGVEPALAAPPAAGAVPGIAEPLSSIEAPKPATSAVPVASAWDDPALWATPARVRPERARVEWTTVLLFLGAFLVIVSAAFFAIVIWDLVGAAAKLGYMGLLTAGFYGAGWWAHRRMGLRTGAVALTTVGSAALLLDGWVAIDGFKLAGPLPWAFVLLACSAAYWASEVMLAERFFGVVGVAAQVGWWWLLGDGLGLDEPVRLAGIAVIMALWQLAAERGADDETLGPLARLLLVTAPVVEMVLLVAVQANGSWLSADPATALASAAVVAMSASFVALRTTIAPGPSRAVFASVPQYVLVTWGASAVAVQGPSVPVMITLALVACVQAVAGLRRPVPLFVSAAMMTTALLSVEFMALFDVASTWSVAVVAASFALWGAVSRFGHRMRVASDEFAASDVQVLYGWAPVVGLALTSLAYPLVAQRFPLTGLPVGADEALPTLGVLAAWLILWLLGRRQVVRFAGSIWSFFVLASLVAWTLPERASAEYAITFVALAGVWYGSTMSVRGLIAGVWNEAARWASRAVVVMSVVYGVLLSFSQVDIVMWNVPVLCAAAAVLFAADTALTRHAFPAASTAVMAVGAAAFMGSAMHGVAVTSVIFAEWWVYGAAAAAALVSVIALAVLWRRSSARTALMLAASIGGSLASAPVALAAGVSWERVVLPFVFLAVSWGVTAVSVEALLVALAALSAHVALLAASTATLTSPVGHLALMIGFGLAMAVVPFALRGEVRSAVVRAASAFSLASILSLSLTMLLGLGGLVTFLPEVWDAGDHGTVVALVALAVALVAASARWSREEPLYAAGLAIVTATWLELGIADVTWAAAYSTPLALYLALCGYAYRRFATERTYPVAIDVFTVLVGVGVPLLAALEPADGEALVTTALAFGVCFLFIAAGVLLKARWYLFGGALGLVAVALYRSLVLFAHFWWVPLGTAGMLMLIVALTWERQRMLVTDARRWLVRSFDDWR